jgi:hypothetical protein
MLNVRNLLYRPSLILLGRVDYTGEDGLDLSTTLTCARFCVASAKDTIQILHNTASRLTGAFWYNIFCISSWNVINLRYIHRRNSTPWRTFMSEERRIRKYRRRLESCTGLSQTHLIKVNLRRTMLKSSGSYALATEYGSSVISLTTDASPKLALEITPQEFKPESPVQPTNPPFDPLSTPSNDNLTFFPQGNMDMQELVWSNLPWDWNFMEEIRVEGFSEGGWDLGNITQDEGPMNADTQVEAMGLPVP